MDYIVMNADGFRGYVRGESISFASDAEVNEAIAEGADLALPHAEPHETRPVGVTPRDDGGREV